VKRKKKEEWLFDPKVFLSKVNGGQTRTKYKKGAIIYRQGEPADAGFYVQSGKLKRALISEQGRAGACAAAPLVFRSRR
jgi:CRP/FNR family cyclic AMP-dependent transcriptional regulator